MTTSTEAPDSRNTDSAGAASSPGQGASPADLQGPAKARSIAARILGAKGGRSRSPAKTRAVRANGKLGGGDKHRTKRNPPVTVSTPLTQHQEPTPLAHS